MTCPCCVPAITAVAATYGVLTIMGIQLDKKWLIYSAPLISISVAVSFFGYKCYIKSQRESAENTKVYFKQQNDNQKSNLLEYYFKIQSHSNDICQSDTIIYVNSEVEYDANSLYSSPVEGQECSCVNS